MKNLILFVLVICSSSLLAQHKITGYAVFYADYFQGRKTANGEIYDGMTYSAASRNFPFGTILKVTRLDDRGQKTREEVYVRVNDRGPFAKECPECILDLSWIAADQIGLTLDGKSAVIIEKVGYSKNAISGPIRGYQKSDKQKTVYNSNPNDPITSYSYKAKSATYPEAKRQTTKTSATSSSNFITGGSQLRSKGIKTVGGKEEPVVLFGYNSASAVIPEVEANAGFEYSNVSEGYGIQLASYVDRSNAIRYLQSLDSRGMQDVFIKTIDLDSKRYFKIIKGNFSTRGEAEKELYRLNRDTKHRGFILLLSK